MQLIAMGLESSVAGAELGTAIARKTPRPDKQSTKAVVDPRQPA